MKKFVFLIFIIALIFVINSCKEQIIDPTDDPEHFSIQDAKLWLRSNYENDIYLKSAGKDKKKHYFNQLWEKAKTYDNQKIEVVEIPLESDKIIGFLTEDILELIESTGYSEYGLGETRLVIQKYKATGKITAHFMTISGDPEYMDITDFKLNKNTYLKKEYDFSGMVLFHNLDGSFHIGWKYKNGEVTHRISSQSSSNSGIRLKVADLSHNCYYITVFECVTTYHWGGSGLIIDDSYVEITDEYMMCEDTGGDGHTVPDGDSGATGGGALPATGTTPEVILDNSFTNTKAECIYDKLITSNQMKQLLSEYFGSDTYHVTYKVEYWDTPGINSTDPTYGNCKDNGDNTVTIKINSYYFDKVAPVTTAKTILHETIHAYLFQEVNDLGGLDNLENSKFENLFAYYQTYGYPDYQHDYMSQYYIPTMATTLKQFDNNAHSIEYYEALAWQGLSYTYGWQQKTQAEKEAINAKVNEINSGDKECK